MQVTRAGEPSLPEPLGTIIDALRRYGTDSSRLVHAFAAQHGLHEADLHALVAIMTAEREGAPLTPGRLRRHLGLSSAGTSYVVDRLERAGHVRRAREHPTDGRVVHLHFTADGMATGSAFFGPLRARTEAVLAQFDPAEVAVITRFLDAIARTMHDHVAEVSQAGDPVPDPGKS